MTISQKKAVFIENYRDMRSRSLAIKNVMSMSSLNKYLASDEVFASKVYDIEMAVISKAEMYQEDLLESEDEKVKQTAIDRILNSKFGREHSRYTKHEKQESQINIDTENIEYKINK